MSYRKELLKSAGKKAVKTVLFANLSFVLTVFACLFPVFFFMITFKVMPEGEFFTRDSGNFWPVKNGKDSKGVKIFLVAAAALLFTVAPISTAEAASWSAYIKSSETVIDTAKTSAVVDTANSEIRLPRAAPKSADFEKNDGYDYLVLTPTELKRFSWTGSATTENTVIKISGLSNPVAAVSSSPYPDAVVATPTGITHYSFTGSSMAPAWSVTGLSGVVSIGSREQDIAVLANGQIRYYGFSGSGSIEIPTLSITSGLTNPIDFALNQFSYDCVVLEGDQLKYFNFTGSGLTHNPALSITGLTAPKSVCWGTEGNITIIDGSQAKTYLLAGNSFVYTSALSVTSGLSAPSCVAVRPGSYDLLIVDGDQVKYYQWDGAQMVYNASLSQTVAGLQNLGSYAPQAAVVSLPKNPGTNTSSVRVRAYHVLPAGTSVTWYLSTDGGTTWTASWRVSGLSGGTTRLEATYDNGSTWTEISGGAAMAAPNQNTVQLWATLPSGNQICWKAVLATTDTSVTPKIKAPNPGTDAAVVWETNTRPNPPGITPPGACYTTATPTITWTFSDPDSGDSQSAYQVVIRTQTGGNLVYDSGKTASSSSQFTVPPDVLFLSGQYQFVFYLTVWDRGGLASDQVSFNFCAVAFDSPRICEIVYPGSGQTPPDPTNPATYIQITRGMAESALPKTQAGGKVGLLVNSIGVSGITSADFPYDSGQHSTVSGPTLYSSLSAENKTWLFEFWTSPLLSDCPSGTRVEGIITGTGHGYVPVFQMQKGVSGAWSEGVVVTDDTVLSNWFVVLQGRKN
ncbi:MAG: hypothetical protein HPY90_12150 [Syntrophothermus sp.]|uniref:glycoside hydrolase family 78 protein n=1 Tax=Syntrophothermus sp. TaxID=2736299 RepID=UPI00257B4EE1|nr:hypothetical protein [Syntrophothermus sp.]NSW84001.1 hypothetical protein [Syntrophothermus sp.]